MNKTSVYIVDDHTIVIDGISSFFIGNESFELIGSALSAQDLFNDLKKKRPDILILDIKLPGLSGIQICNIITKDYPNIKIVFLSSNTDEKSLNEATKSGGKGYFSKDVTEKEFFFGLEKIKNGESYFSKGIQETLFNNYTKQTHANIPCNNDNLTQREIEVIRLFTEGLSYNEIAEQLFISSRTVETHKKNILTKLKLKTTIDLVKYAILNGIISI